MIQGPQTLPRRTVGTFEARSGRGYENPFADVATEGHFTGPDGRTLTVPGFYAGDGRWGVRFNPGLEGSWRYRVTSRPHDPELAGEGSFAVGPRQTRGFLRATPGEGWGFAYENGEPAFIFGDTVYNLFGMAHCGGDVESFLRRRKAQGFNLLRIRVPVSPFHHPAGYSDWQTRRTWAWGGSEQEPIFDRFDLDYFASVERVVAMCEELELGIEMIMEGWGFEFPFNHRSLFTAEWEELWMRYLIARFDAFNCLAIWTPLNEYEYYPAGIYIHKPVADRWAIRIARQIKATAPHGHPVIMHNGPRMPPFAQRFKADPEAVDAIFYQEWGTRDRELGWLAGGIEEQIRAALDGWQGSAVFAEWGYERNPAFELKLPSHQFCDRGHTRRGAWRGVFCGVGIIAGFENSWGPWMELGQDQPGMADLLVLRRFMTEEVAFAELRTAPERLAPSDAPIGYRSQALASRSGERVLVYLPAGGTATLAGAPPAGEARWFNTASGELTTADPAGDRRFTAPDITDPDGRPQDFVLWLGR